MSQASGLMRHGAAVKINLSSNSIAKVAKITQIGAYMGRIFNLAKQDFFTRKFILLSLLPLVCSLIILGTLAFFGGKELFDALSQGAQSGDFSFLDEQRFPIIAKILSFAATKWIIGAIFSVFASFAVLMLSVFCALIIAAFLTPAVTKEINARHYHLIRADEASMARVLKLMSLEILKFLAILFICSVLLFVPVINLFIINVPFFYIYYKLVLIDVASNALSAKSFERSYKMGGGYKFALSAFIFYLLCLIPLVGLFFQLFFIIFLTHIVLIDESARNKNR